MPPPGIVPAGQLAEPIEKVVFLLRRAGWIRDRDLCVVDSPDKIGKGYEKLIGLHPVMKVGARRALVGPTWTTFYTVNWKEIDASTLRSVKTRNIEEVEAEAEGTRYQIDVGGES